MILFSYFLLSLPLALESEVVTEESDFGYYFGEFLTYAMEDQQPLSRLIIDRLAESVFQSETKEGLQSRLRLIKRTAENSPELATRFAYLDQKLRTSFNTRVSKSKNHQMLYTTTGAVIGAVIGLPVGKLISSHTSLGLKVLWITVPATALLGTGAGYLLSELIDSPESAQPSDLLSKDLQSIETDWIHDRR